MRTDRLGTSNDSRISRFRVRAPSFILSYKSFGLIDLNNDGWLVRSEWRGGEPGFTRLDNSRDNRLSRSDATATAPDGIGVASRSDSVQKAGWRAERTTSSVSSGTSKPAHFERAARLHAAGWILGIRPATERASHRARTSSSKPVGRCSRHALAQRYRGHRRNLLSVSSCSTPLLVKDRPGVRAPRLHF
jgi:hypothetical protein